MRFRYRFVNFGTRFHAAAGARSAAADAPDELHENEIALDVGGRCWGIDGHKLATIDHHLSRPGQFPCASAGVLHLAEKIHERFGQAAGDLWLVTHRQPDFDGLCASYLVRCLLGGSLPHNGWNSLGIRSDGWNVPRGDFDWFSPQPASVPRDLRWAVLLAATAARVDAGQRLECPRHRALHSILYAAMLRGRDYFSEDSGATEFFDEVRRAMSVDSLALNPLFDSVLEENATFKPELAMLDRELLAYRRDLSRARKSLVYLPHATVPFSEWFGQVVDEPLLTNGDDGLQLRSIHVEPPFRANRQSDAVFLRDPECVLFKEWARDDLENSALGEGFRFTAVAYSQGRRGAARNETSYYFSLDPIRASGTHLYNVWARLQHAEARALANNGLGSDDATQVCRPGFEGRANEHAALFADPWFDGSNYEATLVVAPGRGTLIGQAGNAPDLSDDPIAKIVREELELRFFEGDIEITDLPASDDAREPMQFRATVANLAVGNLPAAKSDDYRFACIALGEDTELLRGGLAEQLGRLLWPLIDAGAQDVPVDFTTRHLISNSNWIGIWSRQGVVVAYKPHAENRANEAQRLCRELAALARETQKLIHADSSDRHIIEQCETMMRRVTQVKHDLAMPDGQLVQQFFESSRLDELLRTIRDINVAAADRAQAESNSQRLVQQQHIAENMELNLEKVTAVQGVIHLIEYVLVAVYLTELWHTLVAGNKKYHDLVHHAGHWLGEHLRWLNVGNWFVIFEYFHADLLIPISLGLLLVAGFNYNVEGRCVEWQFIRRLFRRGKQDSPHKSA